jgi:hypothetical protein
MMNEKKKHVKFEFINFCLEEIIKSGFFFVTEFHKNFIFGRSIDYFSKGNGNDLTLKMKFIGFLKKKKYISNVIWIFLFVVQQLQATILNTFFQ